MMKKDKNGRYINPEAASEALARMTNGLSYLDAAILSSMLGKINRRWFREITNKMKNVRRIQVGNLILTQGKDGSYIELNRLDPFICLLLLWLT